VTVKTLIDVTKDFDYKMYKFQLKILRRTVYKIDKKYFTSTKSAILTLKTGVCIREETFKLFKIFLIPNLYHQALLKTWYDYSGTMVNLSVTSLHLIPRVHPSSRTPSFLSVVMSRKRTQNLS